MIELRDGRARCTISPAEGGRITSLAVHDQELLCPRPAHGHPMSWGAFVMVPWAGRVRNGAFQFDGNQYQLDLDMPPHAVHGTVYTQPWVVGDVSDSYVEMSCPIGGHWPFGGSTSQRIELADGELRCTLSVTADQLAMPAQVGWHPWFRKPTSAQLLFAEMYQRDSSGIPTGELVAPTPGPWDDTFRHPLAAVDLHFAELVVSISSDCDHWVVYDEPVDSTCVEPQSGPPDGFTLAPHRLEPGETLRRWMTIGWSDR